MTDNFANCHYCRCNQNQWKINGNTRIENDDDNSFRFAFPVTSFNGGREKIYVTCLVDIGESSFARVSTLLYRKFDRNKFKKNWCLHLGREQGWIQKAGGVV